MSTDKSFWQEIAESYGFSANMPGLPLGIYGLPAVKRREDVAKKLVLILIRNQVGVGEGISVLANLFNGNYPYRLRNCFYPDSL